jgi:hypothetical protein
MDHLSDRLATLEQQVHTLAHHTHTVTRQLRWWRGIACGMLVLGLLSWVLPSHQAPDASAAKNSQEDAKKRPKDKDHEDNDVEQRLQALEDKLAAFTFDDAHNEVVITGVNLRIVNGLDATETTNGLGNLIVGYNELRAEGEENIRTGSHNVVVGEQLNFSSFGGIVVGHFNEIRGSFSSVSGGQQNTASEQFSLVSGGLFNTASGRWSSVIGGNANVASGVLSSVSGGINNMASGIWSSVSGGFQRTALGEFDWVAGTLFEDE